MKKRKLFISVAALLIAIVFIVTFIASVFPARATDLNEQLANAKNQRKAAEQELSGIQTKKKNAEEDKVRLAGEIESLNGQITAIQAEITKTNEKLIAKEAELALAEEACEKQFSSFKTRARIMYENGPSTYIEILFGSGSFSEFMSNIQIIKSLLEYDNKILEERKAVREQIALQKAEIENIKAGQETRRKTLVEMKATLTAKQQAQSSVISQLETEASTIRKRIEDQKAEETRIQNLINQALAQQQSQPVSNINHKGTGVLQWPCPSTRYVTSEFGNRSRPVAGASTNHKGLDIGGAMGADIVAADSGTVLFAGNSSSYGKYVVLSHGGGMTTLYAHCSQLLVKAGSAVTKGQVIAKVGSTGVSSGPHLHFEVSVNGERQNPRNYVN